MRDFPDVCDFYHAVPQAAAESWPPGFLKGEPFTTVIVGPYASGKTSALAKIVEIASHHIDLTEMAAFAPSWLTICHLRGLAAKPWPDVNPQTDLFCQEFTGTPIDAMRAHSFVAADKPVHAKQIEREYLKVLAQINDIVAPVTEIEQKFLDSLKPQLAAAIRADQESRLEGIPLPKNAYLDVVREFVLGYKEANDLYDKADLVNGEFVTSEEVKLLLLDDIDAADCALVARHFPNAGIVMACRQMRPADLTIGLTRCLRTPQRHDIDGDDPQLAPPPPSNVKSLALIVPPWRRGPWLGWLASHGLPPPQAMYRWRAIAEAWRYDQGEAALSKHLKPLLVANGLQPDEDWLVEQGDIDGWTNWRRLAGAFDARLVRHADAVLNRYNKLTGLPTVRIDMPFRMRGAQADYVATDSASWIDDEGRDIALSRATRMLVVMTAKK